MDFSVNARDQSGKVAIVDADSGQTITYRTLDERANRVANLLRSLGLVRGDHIAFMLENSVEIFEIALAALRSGLYTTPISTRLKRDEVEYVIRDCEAAVVFLPADRSDLAGLDQAFPAVRFFTTGDEPTALPAYEQALAGQSPGPVADQSVGMLFFYSSGSTGRPKGVVRPLPDTPIGQQTRSDALMQRLWGFDRTTVYLHPAPLYHAGPLQYNLSVLQSGGTVVLMRKFEAQAALAAIERYKVTHTQWVPTMFGRMLSLPAATRCGFDLSSHRVAIHGAAPCPIDVKQRMIDWWGPIVSEYYSATEANGLCWASSEEWLARPGTVGKACVGEIHIVDEDGNEVPPLTPGTIYFSGGSAFTYHNDAEKTREASHPLGWTMVGDMGYVDDDGYLFLTDRKDFMIISGGVNIYPAEAENVLHAHPEVVDVAVIGVPNPDFGEEVKAIVQPANPARADSAFAAELIAYCRSRIADVKCPRTVDFVEELPRLPTGKLQKKLLRAPYWENAAGVGKATVKVPGDA